MGTTLTGTTPQDTYDSLIKVTNNGPLSSTARYLSDGLGNDSVLALSTAQVGIGTSTTSARLGVDNALNVGVQSLSSDPSAASVFLSNTGTSVGLAIATTNANVSYLQGRQKTGTGNAFDIALNPLGGNVGIGTTSPASLLHISQAAADTTLRIGNNSSYDQFVYFNGNNDWSLGMDYSNSNAFVLSNASTVGTNNRLVVTTAGVLQIPQGQIQFPSTQVASADPNTLDDYEEGTFTATLKGSVSDPSTPVTTTGTYTKIGRQVTLRADFINVNTSGASGEVTITGAPFTSAANCTGSVMLFNFDLDTSTAQNCYIGTSTTIEFFGQKDDAAWVNLKHNAGAGRYLIFTISYFV